MMKHVAHSIGPTEARAEAVLRDTLMGFGGMYARPVLFIAFWQLLKWWHLDWRLISHNPSVLSRSLGGSLLWLALYYLRGRSLWILKIKVTDWLIAQSNRRWTTHIPEADLGGWTARLIIKSIRAVRVSKGALSLSYLDHAVAAHE